MRDLFAVSAAHDAPWLFDLFLFVTLQMCTAFGAWTNGWPYLSQSGWVPSTAMCLIQEGVLLITRRSRYFPQALRLDDKDSNTLLLTNAFRAFSLLLLSAEAFKRFVDDEHDEVAQSQSIVALLMLVWFIIRFLLRITAGPTGSCCGKLVPPDEDDLRRIHTMHHLESETQVSRTHDGGMRIRGRRVMHGREKEDTLSGDTDDDSQ